MIVELTGKHQLSYKNQPYGFKMVKEHWDDKGDHIVAILPHDVGLTIDEIMVKTGYGRKQDVEDSLKELILSGLIRPMGEGVRGKPYKYWKIQEN